MNKEKATAEISLNGQFTAPELEEIIADLAKVRAGMQPSVPSEPPREREHQMLLQERTLFKARTLVSGGLRIWLRNDGFGWLAFTINPTQRTELHAFLGKQPGHTHTAH